MSGDNREHTGEIVVAFNSAINEADRWGSRPHLRIEADGSVNRPDLFEWDGRMRQCVPTWKRKKAPNFFGAFL